MELLRRGYKVSIGKYKDFEIDFIAETVNEKIYYQVSESILDKPTLEREVLPLK